MRTAKCSAATLKKWWRWQVIDATFLRQRSHIDRWGKRNFDENFDVTNVLWGVVFTLSIERVKLSCLKNIESGNFFLEAFNFFSNFVSIFAVTLSYLFHFVESMKCFEATTWVRRKWMPDGQGLLKVSNFLFSSFLIHQGYWTSFCKIKVSKQVKDILWQARFSLWIFLASEIRICPNKKDTKLIHIYLEILEFFNEKAGKIFI